MTATIERNSKQNGVTTRAHRKVRSLLGSALLCVAVSGCIPANYIQRSTRLSQQCEVIVCRDMGASPGRCGCRSYSEVTRQMKEVLAVER